MKRKHKRAQYAEAAGLIVLVAMLLIFVLVYPSLIRGEKQKISIEAAKHSEESQRNMFVVKYLQAPVITHNNQLIKMSELIRLAEDDSSYRSDLLKATRSFMNLEIKSYDVWVPGIYLSMIFVPGKNFEAGWRVNIFYPNEKRPLSLEQGSGIDEYDTYKAIVPASSTRTIRIEIRMGYTWSSTV